MRLFFRKSRSKRKTANRKQGSRAPEGELSIGQEARGYDPYDTVAGVSREQFGMRRRADGKWSF